MEDEQPEALEPGDEFANGPTSRYGDPSTNTAKDDVEWVANAEAAWDWMQRFNQHKTNPPLFTHFLYSMADKMSHEIDQCPLIPAELLVQLSKLETKQLFFSKLEQIDYLNIMPRIVEFDI